MSADKATNQARNSSMDKTDADRASGDPYANQGGGKLGSGNVNSGHPANDVIHPHDQNDAKKNEASTGKSKDKDKDKADPGVKGTKGSGTPTLSGAGQLADDRPGRNDPKGEH